MSRALVSLGFALLLLAPAAEGGGNAKAVKITASAAPWTIVGSRIGVTGTVTPHPAGIELTLQQWYGSGWTTLGDAAVRPDGTFSFVQRPDKLGKTFYRVVTAKDTSFAGSSERVPVRVLHWSYVTNIEAFTYIDPISGGLHIEPITAGGVHYEHPVSLDAGCYNQWGGSAWIDYPLLKQYERFTATVGLGGDATNNSTATYKLVGGDGKQLASGSLAFGAPSQKISVSVSGEYRLRVWINVPDPTGAGGCSPSYTEVVFGDAKLLGP